MNKATFAGLGVREKCEALGSDINLLPPDVLAALVAEDADLSIEVFNYHGNMSWQ